jgi:hypothetical protein
LCLLNTDLPSTVGGERTIEDREEEDEMEEAEEYYDGSERRGIGAWSS